MGNSAKARLWRRFWLETVVAAISGSLCLITPLWPDWIESVSGWDPDQHDGMVEWAILTALLLVTIVMLLFAARSRRRLRVADAV
jgi:hypothetical protein